MYVMYIHQFIHTYKLYIHVYVCHTYKHTYIHTYIRTYVSTTHNLGKFAVISDVSQQNLNARNIFNIE